MAEVKEERNKLLRQQLERLKKRPVFLGPPPGEEERLKQEELKAKAEEESRQKKVEEERGRRQRTAAVHEQLEEQRLLQEDRDRQMREEPRRKLEQEQKRRKLEETLKKSSADETRKNEQLAALAVRRAIMRLSEATRETTEQRKQELESILMTELWKCGSFMDLIQKEAERQMEIASRKAAAASVPPRFGQPARFQRPPQEQSRKAAPPIVMPIDIEDPQMLDWARFRLSGLGRESGVRAQVEPGIVKLFDVGGDVIDAERATSVSARVRSIVEQAGELTWLTVDAKLDRVPETTSFEEVAALCDQYGVQIKKLRPKVEILPLSVFGSQEAARDVAAMLWSRFEQGKVVAPVLHVMGQLKAMPKQMGDDFVGDVRSLEKECGVEVTQGDVVIWVSGPDVETVGSAKRTLQEMLQFYLPQECGLIVGLNSAFIDSLRKDEELQMFRLRQESPVVLAYEDDAVWISGQGFGPAKARVEALRQLRGSGS
eukprot:TRINITY_DN49275_c0_g1_i1.p1 TRINITY_DN49275_c0_g1~~TRINITY_DN49275_c0_g1_i1.p1  ORF type:complete len:528 (-),score=128.42 TRINITY_DN49275_c0_g1_i1:97-1557(-)